MELDSTAGSDLAMGASGRADRAAEFLTVSEAAALATTGESSATGLGSPEFGIHKRRSAAESNKDHLKVASRCEDGRLQHWKLSCTGVQVSLAHWSRFGWYFEWD